MPTRIEVVADPVRDRCVLTHRPPVTAPAARAAGRRPGRAGRGRCAVCWPATRCGSRSRSPGRCGVEIVETAGTVAYGMRGGSARWDVDIRLTDGASLAVVRRTVRGLRGAPCHAVDDRTPRDRVHGGAAGVARPRAAWRNRRGAAHEIPGLDRRRAHCWPRTSTSRRRHATGWAVLRTARCLDTVTTLGFRLPEARRRCNSKARVDRAPLGPRAARERPVAHNGRVKQLRRIVRGATTLADSGRSADTNPAPVEATRRRRECVGASRDPRDHRGAGGGEVDVRRAAHGEADRRRAPGRTGADGWVPPGAVGAGGVGAG